MKHLAHRFVLVILIVTLGVISLSAQTTNPVYVLVHGAWQDESAWETVASVLENQGETVIAVQLPGRDENAVPAEQSLDSYRDAVIDVIQAQDSQVILVGHSFGGMVISAVAELIPEQIDTLVYIAAYLPQNGESLLTLSEYEHNSVLGEDGALIISEDSTTISVNSDIFASIFCPDCNEEQATIVATSQVIEPLIPLASPVTLSDENFGGVNKVYILTAEDIVVSPQFQAFMLSMTPVIQVFALNTGHAPYVTAPSELANILTNIQS